jgi:hypothetical protein
MVFPSKPKPKPYSNNGVTSVVIALTFVGGFFLGHIHAGLTDAAQETSLRADALGSTIVSSAVVSSPASGDREYGNGWHSIEVFYGQKNHLEQMLPTDLEWFSQARQDEVVATLLKGKRNGYFVDLAANDATVLSNTYSLEQKFGWTGLCVEPNPMYWANLTYRDCQVVAAIAGNQRMEEVFFRFDAGDHSGIIGFDNGQHLKRVSQPKYTVTLTEILTRFNAPKKIDYLSLDVEGAEEFIMQHFPLKDYTISLMTVERPKDTLRALFEKNGFQFITRLSRWGETLWAHESVMDSLDLSNIEEFKPTKKPKEIGAGEAEAS